MLKVGKISYLNSFLLWSGILLKKTHNTSFLLIEDYPSVLNQKFHSGELDISFVSSIEYITNRSLYTLLPYGIIAKKKVLSVNLYIPDSINSLDGHTIFLTPQSATSVELLKIICHHYWDVYPNYQVAAEPLKSIQSNTAFLLIGDQALLHLQIPGYKIVDLAQVWYEWLQLPFCFGTCVVHNQSAKNFPAALVQFKQSLEDSLNWGYENLEEVIDIAHTKFPAFSDKKPLLEEYLATITYRIGVEEQQALGAFAALSALQKNIKKIS